MKNIKLITILALSSAVLFGGKATANKAKVNFKETVVARSESSGSIADLTIDSDKAKQLASFSILTGRFNISAKSWSSLCPINQVELAFLTKEVYFETIPGIPIPMELT